jgi:hypothetical protein
VKDGQEFVLQPTRAFHFGFDPLACADVRDSGEYESPVAGLDWTQADFDGHFRAIFSEGVEISSGTHRPRVRFREEPGSETGVGAAGPEWNEALDGLADHLVTRVAEHLLRQGIRQHDGAALVDENHRGGSRFHGQPESLVCSLARRDVAVDRHETFERPIRLSL